MDVGGKKTPRWGILYLESMTYLIVSPRYEEIISPHVLYSTGFLSIGKYRYSNQMRIDVGFPHLELHIYLCKHFTLTGVVHRVIVQPTGLSSPNVDPLMFKFGNDLQNKH